MAKILKTERITQPSDPREEFGWIYLTENDAGLRVVIQIDLHGKAAEESSDPDAHKLITELDRIELVKRLSEEQTRRCDLRVMVTEDGRLSVQPSPSFGFGRFEQD
jgi:hypothetical protein